MSWFHRQNNRLHIRKGYPIRSPKIYRETINNSQEKVRHTAMGDHPRL